MAQQFNSIASADVVALLRGGAVGVIPTDTVYGLATSAMHKPAVARLYHDVKRRGPKPGTIVAANIEQLEQLGLKARYLRAVKDFWPNPLSVVIPCGDELVYLHRGKDSLAVRIPADKAFRAFLEQTGPLLTTSANHPGKPTATTVARAMASFGDTVDFYVEGGDLSGRPPSTVIRVVDDAIEILRAGAVDIDENGRIRRGETA